MSLSFEEVNILGQIINDTWGKGSTNYDDDQFESRYGGSSLKRQGANNSVVTKASLSGNILCVTAVGIYNLGPISHQHQVISTAENELNQFINKKMKSIKDEFKKKENAGKDLKTKEDKNKRTTDIQDLNHYAETRPSYVYRRAFFEVS
jgi:hypothetical protein